MKRALLLQRIVGAFERLDFRVVGGDRIESILREHPIDDAALAPYLQFVPGRYSRVRLHRQAEFEILALCWPAQTCSPIHAHGTSRCFVHVRSGTLISDEYALVSGGRAAGAASIRQVATRTLSAGDFDLRTPTHDIHRFTSLGEPAVTLHIYAKPLDRCLVFDREDGLCRSVETSYDRRPR